MTIEWLKELGTVILGSGASFAFVRTFWDIRRDKTQRRDAVEFLALQLAFAFESFAIECAHRASEHITSIESDGHAGKRLSSVPKVPPLPESDAYKLLDRSILNEIMDFPQRCQMAQEGAASLYDVDPDEDHYYETVGENTLKMGAKAVEIAKRIRLVNKLSYRDLSFDDWDINKYYHRELEKVRQAEMAREQDAIEANESLCQK